MEIKMIEMVFEQYYQIIHHNLNNQHANFQYEEVRGYNNKNNNHIQQQESSFIGVILIHILLYEMNNLQ